MVHPIINAIIALISGILILMFPAILNYVVAVYLILLGVLGLITHFYV